MSDIITVKEYKTYLSENFRSAETSNEKDLYYQNILLPGVSDYIKDYFNNDLQVAARTETFSAEEPTKKLFFKYPHCTAVSSVTISGTVQDSGAYQLFEDFALILTGDTNYYGQLVEGYYWPRGYNHIIVNYTAGQELTRGDKWGLCKLISMIDQDDNKTFSSRDEAAGVFGETTAENIFMDMLNMRYRKYVL